MADQTIDVEAALPPRVLREYAMLADGERGALIGPQGDVAWMCAPRWDSDAVFSNLIGGGGVYAVTPTDMRSVWGGYYEPRTLIWRNRWITADGIVECRQALAFPGDPDRVVLLLPPVRGAVPADDPRKRATLDAEGAFLLCGFMMALAEHQLGHAHCAVRWFERNRTACGPPGLLCEEYDVRQRQLRGNLPQAFAHALLLEYTATLAGDAVPHD